MSEADLARLLGTLRYLQGLKVARQKVEAGAANDAEAAADHTSASISHGELLQSPQIACVAKRFHQVCEHTLASVPELVYGCMLPFTLALLSVAWDSAQSHNLCLSIYLVLTAKVYLLAGMGSCPVCHDPLGSELVMLPCGHQLCCRCSMTIIDRAPHTSSPQVPLHFTQMLQVMLSLGFWLGACHCQRCLQVFQHVQSINM